MRQRHSLSDIVARDLKVLVRQAEIDWDALFQQAIEVVVFGSRATGMHRGSSDLDVLIAGKRATRVKRRGLDLICIPAAQLLSRKWLESELAGHIANYGLWIKGDGSWRNRAIVGKSAARRKEKRLFALIRSVKAAWAQLHPVFRSKYRFGIRRELQRLLLLRKAIPIPPTAVLDAEWKRANFRTDQLLDVSNSISSNSATFVKQIILARDVRKS